MKIQNLLCIYLLSLLFALSIQDSCKWTSPNNSIYDFTPLKKYDKYIVADDTSGLGSFELIYVLNLCQPVKCNKQDVSVYEGLKILDQIIEDCDIIAYQQNPQYSFIDQNPSKGVQIQFQGDICVLAPTIKYDENNNLIATQPKQLDSKKKATINIECSSTQEDNFRLDSTDQCNIKFFMKSPVGCVGGGGNNLSSFKILCIFIIFMGAYFFIGSSINKSKYGLTGNEALPNYVFWQDFPYLINDGIKFSVLQLTQGLRQVKDKFGNSKESGISGGYNTI